MSKRVIDYRKSSDVWHGIHFMYECNQFLGSKSATWRTAAVFYHKFFRAYLKEQYKYDPFLVAAASLLLASKITNEAYSMRDIINVCYHTVHTDSTPLALGKMYFDVRDALIQTELLLLRVVQFDVEFKQTRAPLYAATYLEMLEEYIDPPYNEWQCVTRLCWMVLHDFFLSYKVLDHQPQAIALGVIGLVFECYGVEVYQDSIHWFTGFFPSMTTEKLEEIVTDITRAYHKK